MTKDKTDYSNLANRVYFFDTQINPKHARRCIETLMAWGRENDEDITLLLNTPGGVTSDGFAIIDTILELRDSGIHVVTKVRGEAASMGAIICQAGSERVMGPNAKMMLHEGSTQSATTYGETVDSLESSALFHERALDILVKRSKLSKEDIKKKWDRRDWLMNAKQAKKLGLCDRIG